MLAPVLVVPTFTSCDVVKDMFTAHSYVYAHDSEGHWGVCSDCGEKTAVKAHEFSLCETVVATCEHVGYQVFECSDCKYSKIEFSTKTEHDFRTVGDTDVRECVNCHRKESALVELPETERYGYTYLSSLAERDKYLRAYEKISAAIAVGSERASVFEKMTDDEFSTVYHCVVSDHPEYFWVKSVCSYDHTEDEILHVTPSYRMNIDELPLAKEKFNKAADEILSGVSVSMTDFEKELYVHDALVRHNVYDSTYDAPMTHSAYGALVLKTSVCDGYAKLFQFLLTRCGVPATTVSGYAGESHSWNAVKLDGEWYMVDPTWDDPYETKPDYVSHVYFNGSYERFSIDHSFENGEGEKISNYYDVPVCDSDRYDYFGYFGYEGNLSPETIEKVIGMQVEKGERRSFQMRFTNLTGSPEERKEAINNYIGTVPLTSSIERVLGKTALSISLAYSISDDGNILTIFVD